MATTVSHDNPTAFPTDPMTQGGGMTLRDYFAAQALIATQFVAATLVTIAANNQKSVTLTSAEAAASAYELADAMLAERAKGGR